MTSWRSGLAVATIFLVAAIVLSGVLPLWLDEILQLMETRDTSAVEMLNSLPNNPGAAPLGYLVQQAALRVTGFSVRRARLPAALFGCAAVFAVALLSAELGLKRPWLAAAIFAAFPLTIRYATEARIYSQALFFSVLATFLYLRLAKRPSLSIATIYCLALTLAIYTQPYAAFVGLALILWSVAYRDRKTALLGAIGFGVAVLAFLPWYLWSRAQWASGIAATGTRFSVSAKTPLMIFRELAGAGYWGSGLLLILCLVAIARRRLSSHALTVLILLIMVPIVCALTADELFNYFLASRQFIWVLPAVAVLAVAAAERNTRASFAMAAILGLICLRQNIQFFTAPREDFQLAARTLAREVAQGACLMVAPPEQVAYYEFFQPQLRRAVCDGPRVVLAIPPSSTSEQQQAAVVGLQARGYKEEGKTEAGKSGIVSFVLRP